MEILKVQEFFLGFFAGKHKGSGVPQTAAGERLRSVLQLHRFKTVTGVLTKNLEFSLEFFRQEEYNVKSEIYKTGHNCGM